MPRTSTSRGPESTTQMPGTQPGAVPESVRQAVRAMYGGAAVSLICLLAFMATQGSTKTAIRQRFAHLTASQVTTQAHVLLVAAIVTGLIAIAARIIIARASQAGKNWAPDHRHGAVRPHRGRAAVAGHLHRLLQGPRP